MPASLPSRVAPDKLISLLFPTFLSVNDPVILEVTTFKSSPLIPANVAPVVDMITLVFPSYSLFEAVTPLTVKASLLIVTGAWVKSKVGNL